VSAIVAIHAAIASKASPTLVGIRPPQSPGLNGVYGIVKYGDTILLATVLHWPLKMALPESEVIHVEPLSKEYAILVLPVLSPPATHTDPFHATELTDVKSESPVVKAVHVEPLSEDLAI
jgi:hypothetical protein